MTFVEVLLNVLSIIGIVAIGGAVIYFLGGLLLNVLEARNKKESTTTEKFVETQTISQEKFVEQQPQQTYEETISEEKFVLEDDEKIEAIDYNKATEEKKSLSKTEEVEESIATEENNLFSEEKEFNFEDFDFDAFFNEQNETAKKEAEVSEIEKLSDEIAEENAEIQQPITIEPAQTLAVEQSQPVEPVVEQEIVEEIAPQTQSFVAHNLAESIQTSELVETNNLIETTTLVETLGTELEAELRAEISALKAELFEQKRLYDELKAQTEANQAKWEEEKSNLETLYAEAEKREQENANKTQSALSLEEYEARLVVLRDRLKINENQLRLNRKEFIPLKRVRKNLDKDKSKLRRREALVAKQKVLLYGVNNIMEIDQEKAKKLAEDLDLLDGLKVSVRHCEEVMEANKERYPILETANRILVTQNEEIKADILACETAIRKIKAGNGEDVDAMELAELTLQNAPKKRGRGRPRKVKTEETIQQTSFITDATTQKTEEIEAVDIAKEQERLEEIISTVEDNSTVIHTAQTENAEQKEPEIAVVETYSLDDVAPTTKTTIVKKEETQIIHTSTEHKFDFDADEPSMEDLFAIENDNIFLKEDSLFDDDRK